jgi:hypothetical protein
MSKWEEIVPICQKRFYPLAVGFRTRKRYVPRKVQFGNTGNNLVMMHEPMVALIASWGSPYGDDEKYGQWMQPSTALNLLKWLQDNEELLKQLLKEEVD